MKSSRRVVVTGLGLLSPLGVTVESSWARILAGESGIGPIEHFDVSAFPVRIAGSVRAYDPEQYFDRKELRRMDISIQYGVAAGYQAVEHAGLTDVQDTDSRIGVAIGAGMGGIMGIEHGYHTYLNGGPRKISPFFVPANIANMISGNVSIRYGFRGPNIAIVTACTTGTHNIGVAARMIAYGDADVMITGGAEMAESATSMGGFAQAKALSTRNDEPTRASRPWDRDRDGFVLASGAGVLVLEELEHAKARGAEILAELIGFGMSADAYHMTSPPPDGDGAARCMRAALNDAEIDVGEIDYINAHGTSTPAGDLAETQAVKGVFGHRAHSVAVSSTKSMTGHMLGAAGGAEAVFSVLALRDQVAPPTINLENPDPECDLDYVPNHAREMKIDTVVSNSFGFGGTNGTIVLRRFQG